MSAPAPGEKPPSREATGVRSPSLPSRAEPLAAALDAARMRLRTPERRRKPARTHAATAAEVCAAVALATLGVALLEPTAPATGLAALYLLAVLAIAIRRGERAALATAVLSVLVFNYLFIPPRHGFAIAHSQDVVDLVVFLIVAVVVGRLAAAARQRATESERRARLASTREREATLLAEAASAVAEGRDTRVQLQSIGLRVQAATGAQRGRVVLESVPSPREDEIVVHLKTRHRAGWLYVTPDTEWQRADLERLAAPLGRLIDVALEREQVSEQSAEAEAARRTEVAKTAILHAISHDLRSPLTAITTAGSALGAVDLTEEERSELTEVIQGEGARLSRLVDDLLDLSKIQARSVDPRSDWCDLRDVVASAAAQLAGDWPLEFALPPDLPLIRADPTQLERVFSNLLENAVKFSPTGAPVRITGGAAGGRVTVRVIDTGRGIPAQQRAHVFEPFFRGRGGAASGSGLGLAICRGFVEANGGKITLQTGTGQGTAFAVSFAVPRQPETAT